MQKLLYSRRQREENQERISKLSPQKYGKGAFFELAYTPSKLADNVLFRQASNLKRIEEETSKCREYEYQNQILHEQVEYLKRQRDGISTSLNKVIAMYKQIIAEMEVKTDERIRETQLRFKEEIQKHIHDKSEEAKYYQSEKEILEQRIEELEKQIRKLKEDINNMNNLKDNIHHQFDQLTIKFNNTSQNLKATEKKAKEDADRAKIEIERLKNQLVDTEDDWKDRLRDQITKKDRQIEVAQRAHRAENDKIQNQRATESLLKNQQINDLTKNFDSEMSRLKEILSVKDKMIEQLNNQNNKQKAKSITLTRDYQNQISLLTHEKNRLFEEIEVYARDNEVLAKDKALLTDDLERENIKLRDLLYESSMELEKCKNELLGLAKDNARLISRVKSSEEEAKTWRESYYLNKTGRS